MLTSTKKITFVFVLLTISLTSVTALDKYYEFRMVYDEGNVSLLSMEVQPLTEDIVLSKEGSYQMIILDKNNESIYTTSFSIKTASFIDRNSLNLENNNPFERDLDEGKTFFSIHAPYYPGEKIELKKGEELLFEGNIAQFGKRQSNQGGDVVETEDTKISEEELVDEEEALVSEDNKSKRVIPFYLLGMFLFIILIFCWLFFRNRKGSNIK